MLKLLGSILVFAASASAGVFYAAEYQKHFEHMIYIRQVLYMLKGELEYIHAPLGEMFGRVAVRIKDPYKSWFLRLQWELEKRNKNSFPEIWEMCVAEELSELHYQKGFKRLLLEAGDCFSKTDIKTSIGSLVFVLDRMDYLIDIARDSLENQKKLSSCIGIMGGLFLVILFI